MGDIEKQLIDPNFIADRFREIISNGENFALSIIERHSHGESFDVDETTAKAIINKVNEVTKIEINKQLINYALQYENLIQSIALLIAENNARLLKSRRV